MNDNAGRETSLATAVGSARRIRVLFWIDWLGEQMEAIREIESPPVSNHPDPNIQHGSDVRLVQAWMKANDVPSGTFFSILPNVEARREGRSEN